MKTIRTNILNPLSCESVEYLPDHVISFENQLITAIEPYDSSIHKDVEKRMDELCLPGLIDLHVHLSQYNIRGQYRPALLPWLNEVVFPEEHKSQEPAYAKTVSEAFFNALVKAGTTTAVIYTAPYQEACRIAFETAKDMGYRALIGMTMMDMNTPETLLQSTDYAMGASIELYHEWHGSSPLLDYIFTPRFAPTCTKDLMQRLGAFCRDHDAYIQSHLSENKDEIAWVKDIFGYASYTEVYEAMNILSPKTIMAHAIHLDDNELAILKRTDTKIAHCPDSNFYLKSGEFALDAIRGSDISFGLGSDVGAGTTLSMFYHAKMYNYRQSLIPVLPAEALYRITLGAAKVLGMQQRIGSLLPGKEADMIFVDTGSIPNMDKDTVLSSLLFFGSELSINDTYISGKKKC